MKKNKKRNTIKYILVISMVVIVTLLILINTSFSHKEASKKIISVCSGDTLWSIAKYEKENNEYYKEYEIREIIYKIKKLNNLSNSNLKEGQELIINVI